MYLKFKYSSSYLLSIVFLINLIACTGCQNKKEQAQQFESKIILFEEFDKSGKPESDGDYYWHFKNDIYPAQNKWEDFISGDGYARITIDSDVSNDRDKTFPFQYIAFGSLRPGHRLEMSAKGIAVSGVGGFIFTYIEDDNSFDEIDIEIVPDDANSPPDGHSTDPPNGWTDARFNSWANSSLNDYEPSASYKKPVVDSEGNKVSLNDNKFHTYTIDWRHFPGGDGRKGRIDFYIDNVRQQTISYPVPDSPTEVIIGFRQMSWTGELDWPGTHDMLIDWVKIETIPKDLPAN